ncbi:hypothetical protein SKAU_G00247120 [Synaphobranchus kaupii]|uniref:Uncharacterized protein n=1 Tax=Synaphobranchus kaupii TaxID=118154 RepID=A0A9Q1IRI9_SYNKA|nr:hypothetical protein SKAU_G00247120 [Synaphobranchus kaupii]
MLERQEKPGDDCEGEFEASEESEAVGRTLLDRLTVPVVFPDGTEQYFGSPGDMAASARTIRERMKLVELKRMQQEGAEHPQEDDLQTATEDS